MPSAGEIIRAADVARTIHEGACSAVTNINTTTSVDITGATVTFTTSKDNVECMVVGFADADTTTSGYGTGLIELDVDGAKQSALMTHEDTVDRTTIGQTWFVTLATAGSHTLKLTGRTTIAAGALAIRPTHTKFVATVYDVTS